MVKRLAVSLTVVMMVCLMSIGVYAASDTDFIHANAGAGTQGEVYTAGTWNTSQQGYRVTVVDSSTGEAVKPVTDFVYSAPELTVEEAEVHYA